MRSEPTLRIPLGILAILVGLVFYAGLIARYLPGLIAGWPILVQSIIYLILGIIWIFPLRRFLHWMELGSKRD